jgi:hypothetical protein
LVNSYLKSSKKKMDKKLSKNEEKVDESFEMKILKRNPTENEKTTRRKISGRKGQWPYRPARSLWPCSLR